MSYAHVLVSMLALPLLSQNIDLATTKDLKLVGVTVEQVTYKDKKALRVTYQAGEDGRSLAILPGIDFENGVIEYEFAGDVKPNAPPEHRGFTGLAFRVAPDGTRYECFYQRPLNAVSQNEQQRKHTVQYISMPGYGWRKLRTETPGKYETWADIKPGDWARVRIEVKGKEASIFINDSAQPLLTADLKQGQTRGTLALWVDIGTVGHFANLKVRR